jgi:hypothetical protein
MLLVTGGARIHWIQRRCRPQRRGPHRRGRQRHALGTGSGWRNLRKRQISDFVPLIELATFRRKIDVFAN